MPKSDNLTELEKAGVLDARMFNIQLAAANQLAESFTLCTQNSPNLSDLLWQSEQSFYRKLADFTELTIGNIDSGAREINFGKDAIIIVSHHVPIDTAIPVRKKQFQDKLRKFGREDLSRTHYPDELQIVSVHEGVLASVLSSTFPSLPFNFAKIQARIDTEPIKSIQENDRSILLPYAENAVGGFEVLTRGIKNAFELSPNTIVTGFPDVGRPRPTIEDLMPFRTGIFAAASKVAADTGKTITILPIVYVVSSEFGIKANVLSPHRLSPSLYDPVHREPIKN